MLSMIVPSTHLTMPTTSFVNWGLSRGAPTKSSTSCLISSIFRIGRPLFLVDLMRSSLLGLIAMPRSVIITSINSPGPTSVVTLSTMMGKPDNALVDFSSRFRVLEEIIEVTTKPIIIDGDNGGELAHFGYRIKTLERLGVSAIIIEDKRGLKKNSLFGTDVYQEQESIENFSLKIKEGKKSSINNDFMIIARIESLVLRKGMDDALKRAEAYIDSGADGIMIHSKEKDPDEIIKFCNKYNNIYDKVPLVVVPSTFNIITEMELYSLGVNIVIYANHLIRSAYPNMLKTAELILKSKRSKEASEKYCMSIKEIINLIPE